ncbi:MAG: hypothetical protein ACEROO_10745 [Candidatus Bathyarchaeota archaeon]
MNLKPLILLLILGAGVVPVFADFPRHVDPALLELDNPDPDALFEMYGGIYGSIIQSEYAYAFGLVEVIDELYATPEAKKSISDYNELLRLVISELNETEVSLDQAINELFWLRETEAYQSLLKAAPHLVNANSSTFYLGEESRTIARVLEGSPVELLAGTEEVEVFVDALDQMIFESFLRVDQIIADKLAGLEETTLTASINKNNPFPGETVLISGNLFSSDGGITGKSIEVKLAGDVLGVVETGDYGRFNYEFVMPEYYVKTVSIQVSYWPPTEEIRQYSPAITRLTLRPSFFTPSLGLDISENVYPGVQYPFKSNILYLGEPLGGLSFIVNVFGREYTFTSDENGEATIFINVPDNAPTGRNQITLVFRGQGIYGPTSITRTLVVERVEAFIELDSRGIHLSGGDAVVSGVVKSRFVLISNCVVEVQLGENRVTTITDMNGEFRATFPIALLSPSIKRDFTVSATPEELWITKAYLSNSFLVLNSLLLIVVSGVIVYYRLNKRPKPIVENPVIPVSPILAPIQYRQVTMLAGIYVQAVKIVTRITGSDLGPSTTIREYLDRVKHIIKTPVFLLFRRLSRLYESWIYGRKTFNPPIRTSSIILERMQDEDE